MARRFPGPLGWLREAGRALPVVCLLLFFRGTPLALEVLHHEGRDGHAGRCGCPLNHEDPSCPCPTCQSRLKNSRRSGTTASSASRAGTPAKAPPDCHGKTGERERATASAAAGAEVAPDTDGEPEAPTAARLARSCSLGDAGHPTPTGSVPDPYLLTASGIVPPIAEAIDLGHPVPRTLHSRPVLPLQRPS